MALSLPSLAPLAGPLGSVAGIASGNPAPLVNLGAAGSPQDIGPYSPNLPKQQQAIQTKYSAIASQLGNLPPAQVNALIDLDSSRVAKGQAPLAYKKPDDPTWQVLQTSLTGKPATPPAERNPLNVPGNALHDLSDIVRGLPRLPQALLSIPSHPERIVDMIPGAFIARNLMEGHPLELATHPVNTLLDVLPYASKLAEGTRVAKLAEAAAEESKAANIAGLPREAGQLTGTTRPLSALLGYRVDDAGNLARSGAGELADYLRNQTRVGQSLDTFFGQRSRDMASMVQEGQLQLHGEATGVLPTDEFGTIAREAHDFWQQYPSIPDARIPELHQIATIGDPAELASITDPHELAALQRYRDDLLPRMKAMQESVGDLGTFDGESYAASDYHALMAHARSLAKAHDFALLKQAITDPSTIDSASVLQQLHDTITAPGFTAGARDPASLTRQAATGAMSATERSAKIRGLIRVLDAQGFDVDALTNLRRTASPDDLLNEVQNAMANGLPVRPRYATQDIVQVLQKYARAGDTQADRLAQAIRQGPSPALTRALDNLMSRVGPSQIPEMADPVFADSIRRLRTETRFLNTRTMQAAGEGDIARATTRLENLKTKTVPARFTPLVDSLTGEKFTERVMATLHPATPEEAANFTQAIMEKRWGALPGYTPEELTRLYREVQDDVASSWQELKAQGYDPVFVHAVDPRAVGGVINPRTSEIPTTITSARKRALDSTGGVRDWSIGLHHQAMEYLSRRVSEDVLDHIRNRWGVAESDLREALAPETRALMARNPRLAFDDAMNMVASRSMRLFNPEELGYNWGGTRLQALSQDRVWIPKSLYSNLKELHNPRSLLGGILDPTTRVFRIAVTGLSPRLHVYNILGGATMLLGEAGPGAFKYMSRARELLRDPEALASLARTDPEIARMIGGHAQFFKELDFARPGNKDALLAMTNRPESVLATRDYLFGKTLNRLWQQVQESRGLSTARDAFGKVLDKSYGLNGKFDDMYRAMAYMQGKAGAEARGLSLEAQRAAGMEMARKSLMDYASMTPMERSVIRSVFPFYSFTRHAIGYVLRYPFDHPLRAGVIAALGRAEIADATETLPSRLLGSVFLGHMDDHGRQTALNLTPVNPFGDVANMMTLQGFLGGANPVVDTVLQAIGVDRGQAELYPTLRYNPDTGRLDAVHPNPLLAMVHNTIPQSEILTGLLGLNTDFQRQLHTDPHGALRSLVSAGGLPILWRQYNVPLEQYKGELAREQSLQGAIQGAQQSGDWSEALRYPGGRDAFAAVDQSLQQDPTLAATMQIGPQVRSDLIARIRAQVPQAVTQSEQGRAPAGAVSRGV